MSYWKGDSRCLLRYKGEWRDEDQPDYCRGERVEGVSAVVVSFPDGSLNSLCNWEGLFLYCFDFYVLCEGLGQFSGSVCVLYVEPAVCR